MCGTGVGFSGNASTSTSYQKSQRFMIQTPLYTSLTAKLDRAKAYRELIAMLFTGQVPKWDVSGIRPAGATLKTFGGRASGPEPLVDLFQFTIDVFRQAAGRKLSSIECHDICCKIAQIVVVGGVRRSALISLSNLTDDRIDVLTGSGG